MKKDMICPACGELGFSRAAIYVTNGTIKCELCGEWNDENTWEPLMSWKVYRAEIETLHAASLDLTERVLYAERERDEARESFLAHDAALTTEHGLRTEAEAWLETALSKVNKLTAELARKDAALEQLARLGNGEQYGNSIGNTIARDALEAK